MTTSTLGLDVFLLARIAEDEESASLGVAADEDRAGDHDGPTSWDGGIYTWVSPTAERYGVGISGARLLAECEAKRRIVALWQAYGREGIGDWRDGYTAALSDAMAHLATPYSDHPDYREEWAA